MQYIQFEEYDTSTGMNDDGQPLEGTVMDIGRNYARGQMKLWLMLDEIVTNVEWNYDRCWMVLDSDKWWRWQTTNGDYDGGQRWRTANGDYDGGW
jgi:hypothetical protein